MMKLSLIALSLLILAMPVMAKDHSSEEMFSIYLVRHAEKKSDPIDPGNPGLSECGQLRAQSLAGILADANIEIVYSTDYARTLATARPSAETFSLGIELYDPQKLSEFARLLTSRQQDALVVGHSNTTGILAGLLTGGEQEEFDEDIYDRLYQVVISGKRARMILLHQAFHCESRVASH